MSAHSSVRGYSLSTLPTLMPATDFDERPQAARRWVRSYEQNDIASTKERQVQFSFFQHIFFEVLGRLLDVYEENALQ